MQDLKLTPILIVFGIVELILLIFAFNYLFIDNKGGMALAGTLAFIGAVGNIVILAVEQVIANKVANSKLLWLVELILIVLLAIYISINGITFWQ